MGLTEAEITELDRYLREVSLRIPFSGVNPLNEQREKIKFFSRKGYNPIFVYEPRTREIGKLKKDLSALSFDNSIMGRLLRDVRDSFLERIDMISNVGKQNFTDSSIKVYGRPSPHLVDKALSLFPFEKEKEDAREVSSAETVEIIRDLFAEKGLDWKVNEHNTIASASVRPSSKSVLIRANALFSKKFVKRLIVHEVMSHVYRAANGYRQPYAVFSRGLLNYLATEEGLALYNEEMAGYMSIDILERYVARVIAVHLALRHPFYEVYRKLHKLFGRELAWTSTMRAKRGISDTSKPGAYTKDHLYLAGYYKVKNFVDEGNDINMLYYGKIGVEHVELVKYLPGVTMPLYLPDYLVKKEKR